MTLRNGNALGTERRKGHERRGTLRCVRCRDGLDPARGRNLRRVGHPNVGAQIWKCAECGQMDRRLPADRRAPWTFDPGVWRRRRRFWTPMSVATILAALLALLGALIGSGVFG